MILIFLLISFGNGKIYTNDPFMDKTSYSFRSQLISFPILMFYNNSVHNDAERMSKKWLDDSLEILMLTKAFNYGKDDYRDISLTFGDIDINNVWQYYYHNKTAFKQLQQIKLEYDPIDLFHTKFTTPLPIDGDDQNKQDL